MNREEKRKVEQRLRTPNGRKMLKTLIEKAAAIADRSSLKDGDIVKLNAKRIMERSEWGNLDPKYKTFVEQNQEKEFVARAILHTSSNHPVIFNLEGVEWNFWEGDLIRVKNVGEEL